MARSASKAPVGAAGAESGSPTRKEDGRTRRSAATRRAVAEAYLDLVEGGEVRPTARAVAGRAGVSERAVFRHFQDMETLHHEAAARQIRRVARDIPPPAPTTGPLADRIRAISHRWCTTHERVTPVRRAALLQEAFSTEIAARLDWVRGVERAEIESTFVEEFAGRDASSRSALLAALCALLSWETWNELRLRHELTAQSAEETVTSMVAAILAAPPN